MNRPADFFLPTLTPPSWSELGRALVSRVPCTAIPAPRLGLWNRELAGQLGWPAEPDASLQTLLAGNAPGLFWCSAYAGHQFGHWAGPLGDGRAHTLGCLPHHLGPQEIQLKGAGLTPYSRQGDGRAVLRSSLREYLCSEAMAGLGIPTTRALALMTSDLPIRRETIETAAVVTRVAPSFLRFGHLQHLSHHGYPDLLKTLLDLLIDLHDPECRLEPDPIGAWFLKVVDKTARLIAQWQSVGFCHGVMNTDNLSLLGLTLDYGPFGFLDEFDFHHVCNHSDHEGRYAYNQQPAVAAWNCAALAQALVPFVKSPAILDQGLDQFAETFHNAHLEGFRHKLGLTVQEAEDHRLVFELLTLLDRNRTDFTRFFRGLSDFAGTELPSHFMAGTQTLLGALAESGSGPGPSHLTDDRQGSGSPQVTDHEVPSSPGWDEWLAAYRARLVREPGAASERQKRMKRVNPRFILRNTMAQEAIEAAQGGNFAIAQDLLGVLSHPFDDHPEWSRWAGPVPEWGRSLQLSCSS